MYEAFLTGIDLRKYLLHLLVRRPRRQKDLRMGAALLNDIVQRKHFTLLLQLLLLAVFIFVKDLFQAQEQLLLLVAQLLEFRIEQCDLLASFAQGHGVLAVAGFPLFAQTFLLDLGFLF